ncbi:hypothetical protein Vadar_024618 [Vaccinium darrowii]|uniref:Uncharacterized protein n=1 Tax=Vaccinium darrowii TaxID=229202 RepID=A0ACB7XJU6_9ERIC|nr:hypothetical protein Vadar_024618 [Vaccinium darrowii]
METPSIAKVSLKLLIDTKGNRVLFAEAGKDFVDFLFNLLHLPLGTVVRLITEQRPMGNLYESIQNMSETYFLSNQTKDSLLKPKPTVSATEVPLLPLDGGTSLPKKYYTCLRNPSISNGYGPFNYHGYVTGFEAAKRNVTRKESSNKCVPRKHRRLTVDGCFYCNRLTMPVIVMKVHLVV